jgi:FtsH-binding integral membrane protein
MFEANVALINKKGKMVSVLFTLLVLTLLCTYSFYFEGPIHVKESRPFKLFLVYFITTFIPLCITFIFAWFSKQHKQGAIHFIAILSAFINTAVVPFLALFTSCYTGLGCV